MNDNKETQRKAEDKLAIRDFFKKSFEEKPFVKSGELELPILATYISHEDYVGDFGKTCRFIFDVEFEGETKMLSLLIRGKAFRKAVETYLAKGDRVYLNKNDQGFWYFG